MLDTRVLSLCVFPDQNLKEDSALTLAITEKDMEEADNVWAFVRSAPLTVLTLS